MIYLNIDENNYLLSIATVGGGVEAKLDLAEYDLTGDRINAHKWENDTLIFDADKYAEIQAEKEAEQEQAQSTEPTEMEQLRADVDYIAIMTGIEL